jgi:zinc-binding alcohol dehydrogenase/oxidoreductase
MLAIVVDHSSPDKISIKDLPKPAPGPGEVLIKIKAVALNHRDQWIREGRYPNIKDGVILGSDGAGIIEETGNDQDRHLIGEEVIINPNINWGENPEVQAQNYKILGTPENGTFAEYVIVPKDRIHHKPLHMNWNEAAALPLAGLTAYRALFHHGKVQQGQNILINGIGGGVAQFALLFSVASGANTYVTSASKEKIETAIFKGAKDGFIYKEENWFKEAQNQTGGFHLIIDSAGGNQMNQLIKITRPAGKIVFYGATTGLPQNIDLYRLFWNQITLQGSTMGNDNEFAEMVAFVERHEIKPVLDSFRPFSQAIKSFDAMKDGTQLGKLVLSLE